MVDKIAILKYSHNSFEVIENGTYVICAVSGKKFLGKLKLLERRSSGTIFFLFRSKSEKRKNK